MTSPPLLALSNFDVPFVVERDASSVAVEAVSAQKKEDEKVYPVQYASTTMNTAEKNFYAWERQELAVIFDLKNFSIYLLSTAKFRLIIHPRTLQYTFK